MAKRAPHETLGPGNVLRRTRCTSARDGDVVRGLFPGAGEAVHLGAAQTVGGLRGEQHVVDTDAVVLLPGAGLIVPERVDAGAGLAGAQSVGEAERLQAAQRGARFRLEERVVDPRLRALGVDGLGDDVVVAGEDEGFLLVEQIAGVRLEPLHPGQLVGKFLGRDRVAVGQVNGGDAERGARHGDDRLDVARLIGIGILRQAAAHVLYWVFREQGDAVEAFLAEHGGAVAQIRQRARREALVHRLDFLQAHDVGLAFLEPGGEAVDAGADAVDIPGGDFHEGAHAKMGCCFTGVVLGREPISAR
jgi:hypothetical protein